MKKYAIFIFVFALYIVPNNSSAQKLETSPEKISYYFCTSRAWDLEMVKAGKQEILYTEIKSTQKDPGMNFAQKWSQYAQANSKYEKCTGDVFWFKSLEKAREKFNELIFAEPDKNDYKLVEINLE
jgi:hypothetical protein